MLEVFALAAELAIKDGVAPLCRLPGVWERQIDDNWKIVLNGHNSPKDYNVLTIPPFHMYVEFNGWPAGLLSPFGGTIAAGTVANENALISALKKALE
ncbi:hypothetical protein [Desulfurispora thermophila]|uniref:hypothetical protein n=1 Tax=Desulfurispora thermophila TaxID=265470 RepID=UPI000363B6BD|nr:hypothetical protein [Desulfurispora thermophila]